MDTLPLPRRVLGSLLDLLFPPRCVACGEPGSLFCARCLAQVEFLHPPLCVRCGEPLTPQGRCPRHGRHPHAIDGLRSAAWHAGPLRQAIHRFKYGGVHALKGPLSALLAECWRQGPLPVGLLLPVPLHPQRVRERGFNQAALLARQLSHEIGIPCDERALRRIRHTPPQVGLGAAERLANVQGAFSYVGPALRGQAVCLLDDICTTGATLDACAAALKEAGAGAVWALTLARPHWGEEAPR